MDFATVTTLGFKTLHVFFILSHRRRIIEYFSVTGQPTAGWVQQQIRNAASYGRQPKYLIHDNDPVFTARGFQNFLVNLGIRSKWIAPRSPWQNGIAERLVGIIRRDLLDHVIPFNERHLILLLKEYVLYYNQVRTHQAINAQTPIRHGMPSVTLVKDTRFEARPILGGLYYCYEKRGPDKVA